MYFVTHPVQKINRCNLRSWIIIMKSCLSYVTFFQTSRYPSPQILQDVETKQSEVVEKARMCQTLLCWERVQPYRHLCDSRLPCPDRRQSSVHGEAAVQLQHCVCWWQQEHNRQGSQLRRGWQWSAAVSQVWQSMWTCGNLHIQYQVNFQSK